jgi:dienelactone hydrolase
MGDGKSLVGVVTRPIHEGPSDNPVVVILNTGIIHRVGHHRMYVTLARKLAALGYKVLRFDLSGIGDSEMRTDELSPLDGAIDDIREVVTWLKTTHRAERIILVGLCSGADHALMYGSFDPAVVGLVLLDPSIPPTRKQYVLHLWARLLQPGSWVPALARHLRMWRSQALLGFSAAAVQRRYRVRLNDREVRAFLEQAYERTVRRGTQFLAVFTSGLTHRYSYRQQMLDALAAVPFEGRLSLEYLPGCDHLFTAESDRKRLFNLIIGWLQNTQFVDPHQHNQPACVERECDESNQPGIEPAEALAGRKDHGCQA